MAQAPSRVRASVAAVGWAIVGLTLIVVLTRWVGVPERSARLFALEVLAPLLVLPALTAVALGVVLRRRMLMFVAVLTSAIVLAGAAPDLRWWPVEQPASVGPPFRIATANVLVDNARPASDTAAELVSLQADVLVVTELTPLVAAALAPQFPHRVEDPDEGSTFGSGIYSQHPIVSSERGRLDGFPTLRATVSVHGRDLDVLAVHTLQPLAGLGVLRRQLIELTELAAGERGPLVLAGDFNATRHHRSFRRLLATSLRDAHLETGRGLARTWPANHRVPPFALLDHVLVSPHLAVTSTEEVEVTGSDHRSVVATVRWARHGGDR